MRLSQLLSKTLREPPSDAETPSCRLLIQGGLIYQVTSGVFSFLPLGWRVHRKIENIIRQEMERVGGQELSLSILQPIEIWQRSGRLEGFSQTAFHLKDRKERRLLLGPTHEELIALIAKNYIKSYRDLPLLLYQIQPKFRDELRPRGGLLRVREFVMKDLYSFDADEEGLEKSYQTMLKAYQRIYQRCGVQALIVEADSGAIGGKESHEFMILAPSGEDTVIYCSSCGYAANAEKARFFKGEKKYEPLLPIEDIATPGISTIPDLARFLDIPEEHTLKAVFYLADGEVVFVTIRGDLEVNEVKLKNLLKAGQLRLAAEEEVERAGLVSGSASPIGISGIKKVADDSITLRCNWVAGANRPDTHLRNINYPRDFEVDIIGDIALAKEGYQCPCCGRRLTALKGIEAGHTFKLGTFLSEKLGAYYLDREGNLKPVVMGCYGIGVGRLMAAVVEANHDDKGIIWPPSIAPYLVYLCPIRADIPEIASISDKLYQELEEEGIEVLYDDRDVSTGVKFNDADLLGIPLRLTISPRNLKEGKAEAKKRWEKEPQFLPLENLGTNLKNLLKDWGWI